MKDSVKTPEIISTLGDALLNQFQQEHGFKTALGLTVPEFTLDESGKGIKLTANVEFEKDGKIKSVEKRFHFTSV